MLIKGGSVVPVGHRYIAASAKLTKKIEKYNPMAEQSPQNTSIKNDREFLLKAR